MASGVVVNTVRLPFQIAMQDDELPASFVSRVAIANGFRSGSEFCAITGMNRDRLIHGSEYEIKLLAEWTGVDPAQINAFTFKQGHLFAFGQAVLKTRGFCRDGFRFCSECYVADTSLGPPVIRATWQWLPISCCPVHGIPLASSSGDVGEIGAVPEMANEAFKSTKRLAYPKAIALSKYLTDRILRSADDDFVGRLPLYVALEFFDVLGSLHRRIRQSSCLGTGRFELAQAGYQIAQRGPDAVSELLSRYTTKGSASSANRLRVKIYGDAKQWLWRHKDDADYSPIADLFQSQARWNPSFATGGISARKARASRTHTVRSASEEYCVPVALVERFLKERGVALPSDCLLSSFKFDAAVADELFGGAGIPLGLHQAAEVLGCSPATIIELLDLRLLDPLSSDKKDVRETFVSSANLSRLLKRIYRDADTTAKTPGLRSLPHCAIASGVSEGRIVGFILAGHLSNVAIAKAQAGLGALYVSLREVLTLKSQRV
ncbi:TniQ family protein [Rhizobium jaguaris]|uniref:TniQ domain-containing protein n=1 Tax=Rhizobium jaguaris TaxID=1312183 RepID=A0A387FWN4_9HYPH|nr:TniQ family protein [Rhizobium jaguaris]AYG59932.1 hypothetical protein CCGE525_14785 [Rhizobium jaguaris]